MKTYQEHLATALLAGAVLSVFASASAALAERPALPGIGAQDRRIVVDAALAPWRSLVKVQTNLGGRCTGVLVDPRRVVTAAHCLYNGRTRRYLPVSSLHVLFGYARGEYSGHVTVSAFTVPPDYDPTRPLEGLAGDWAVLDLAKAAPAGVPPLPLATEMPPVGSALALGGYSQDKAQIVTADIDCRLLGGAQVPGGELLLHDCAGTRGTSGAALLAEQNGNWEVVGIAVAAGTQEERHNLAVPSSAFASALRAGPGAEQP